MLSSYRAVFARKGARSLALSCGLGWLSFASYGLALVLATEATTGSFAVAGAVVAAFSAGSALFAPVRGRIVDRRGPRVLPYFAAAHGTALTFVVVGCLASGGAALLVVCAGVAGLLHAAADRDRAIDLAAGHRPGTRPHRPRAERRARRRCAGRRSGADRRARRAGVARLRAGRARPRRRRRFGAARGHRAPERTAAGRRAVRPRAACGACSARAPGLRVVVACELLLGLSFGALDVAAPVVAAEAGAVGAGRAPARRVRRQQHRRVALVRHRAASKTAGLALPRRLPRGRRGPAAVPGRHDAGRRHARADRRRGRIRPAQRRAVRAPRGPGGGGPRGRGVHVADHLGGCRDRGGRRPRRASSRRTERPGRSRPSRSRRCSRRRWRWPDARRSCIGT